MNQISDTCRDFYFIWLPFHLSSNWIKPNNLRRDSGSAHLICVSHSPSHLPVGWGSSASAPTRLCISSAYHCARNPAGCRKVCWVNKCSSLVGLQNTEDGFFLWILYKILSFIKNVSSMNHSCSHSVNVMAPFNMCQDLPVGDRWWYCGHSPKFLGEIIWMDLKNWACWRHWKWPLTKTGLKYQNFLFQV